MKQEHKKIIGDLIDIFDDYEELSEKKIQRNVEACHDYNKYLFYRLCDISKSDFFSFVFYTWYLDHYKTYDDLIDAVKKGEDDFLRDKYIKLIKLSEITMIDIVHIFNTELREYFKNKQKEENDEEENDND